MFNSFFLAGFEGSTGYNRHGRWFDQVVATGHDRTVDLDYGNIAELGMHAARETVRWPLVDTGNGAYDFSTVDPFLEAANQHGIDIIWDLFHYGYPLHLDPWCADFAKRFADYCFAIGSHIDASSEPTCFFTPVNEPSFLAYAGGEKGLFAPYGHGRGWELKVALCRAAIAGIEALWAASPGCRIVNVDPLCRAAVAPERAWESEEAQDFNDRLVFQAWDMLAGRLLPELGGSRAHLDIVGINYYWTNQWEWRIAPLADGRIPPLADDDQRRVALSELVYSVWSRYGGELIVTETAHVGDQRGPWLHQVAREAAALLQRGVPLNGVCLYPILGMPEWHEPDVWTPMGLWDPVCVREPCGERLICEPMREALASARWLEQLRRRIESRKPQALSADGRDPSHRAACGSKY
jgi:hypothetical protein